MKKETISEKAKLPPFRVVGWLFFFEDDTPSGRFFEEEKEALNWIDSEECLWDGYIEPVYAIGDGGRR